MLLKNCFLVGEEQGGLAMSILGDLQMTNTILANIVYGINMECLLYRNIFPSSNLSPEESLVRLFGIGRFFFHASDSACPLELPNEQRVLQFTF